MSSERRITAWTVHDERNYLIDVMDRDGLPPITLGGKPIDAEKHLNVWMEHQKTRRWTGHTCSSLLAEVRAWCRRIEHGETPRDIARSLQEKTRAA